ncbi:MAG: hypothetical protein IKF78_08660 [Atopobiaceae bacterium]|nr:hypothetical protein [Atopobiaceae bacterium]
MHRPATQAVLVLGAILLSAMAGAIVGMVPGVCVACALFALLYLILRPKRQSAQRSQPEETDASGVPERSERLPQEADVASQDDAPTAPEKGVGGQGTEAVHGAPQDKGVAGDESRERAERTHVEEEPDKTAPTNEEPQGFEEKDEGSFAVQADGSDDAHSPNAAPFDYDEFLSSLYKADRPLGTLASFAKQTHVAEGHGDNVRAVNRFLTRLLDEANIEEAERKDSDKVIDVITLGRSGMIYLRTIASRAEWGSLLRIIRIEAALNALRYAHERYDDLNAVSVEDLYRQWQRACSSICAQAPNVGTADWSYLAMPWQAPFGPSDQGEWAVRLAMSEAIESVQVPYRLEARFRCNVSAGDVALEFNATPARVFARSAFVDGLGIVPTTSHMRKREASSYAARVGILLANHAFRASSRIRRVWVRAVEETPNSHAVLYSVCMGRKAFSNLRMDALGNPLDALRLLGASIEEQNGVLVPTPPIFYLEDESFCPRFRHDLWDLSERTLPAFTAASLGATRVSDLAIHEELPRTLAADKILGNLATSSTEHATQQSVRAIMEVAEQTSDVSVWNSAERTARKLVLGSLDPTEHEAIRSEIVEGDALTQAVEKAQELLMQQRAHEALRILEQVLDPLERRGTYVDTKAIAYRCFDSFPERVVYNRLNARDKRSVVLVPDAYLIAHLVASAVLMALPEEDGGNSVKSIAHARRALEVAPLNGPAHLGMASCLEAAGDNDAARKQLKTYLQTAYHPQGMGIAYFKLASLEHELGHEDCCLACYQMAATLFPPLLPFVLGELQPLLSNEDSNVIELMDSLQVREALRSDNVPMAPTSQTSYILFDGATASVDAEVFPVARELIRVLESLWGDDVLRGIRTSLEHEPDE